MTKHDHHKEMCKHGNVKYCVACDVTYCCDCKREWGIHSTWYPWTYTNPGSATITTSGTEGSDYTFVGTSCSHA